MAYNTATGRAEYTASSGQTIFTFVFKIFNTSDIKVYLTPVGQESDDITDLLTITTDYTVVINGDSGGDVTLVVPATTGDKVTIQRDLQITREIDYQENGDFLADTVDTDQNYQTYLIDQNNTDISRSLILPNSAQGIDTTLPNPEAGQAIGWNNSANGLQNISLTVSTPNTDTVIVDTQADLKVLDVTTIDYCYISGASSKADGKGGWYYKDLADTVSVDDADFIIVTNSGVRFKRSSQFTYRKTGDNDLYYRDTAGTEKTIKDKLYIDTLDGQNVKLTGDQTIAGVKTLSSFAITPSSAPTTDYQVANKKYVDDSATVSVQTSKAWVNFNGTGTVAIRDSYNVSSVTDNGVGDYTVNFTNAMNDANYSFCISGRPVTNTTNWAFMDLSITADPTINDISVFNQQSGGGGGFATDSDFVSVVIFGS